MKILHIVSNISIRNGIMSVIMSYYRNIDINNFSFEFLYFDDREFTYEDEIKKLGGKVHKIKRSKNPLKLFFEINKFLKMNINEYQIIHLHEVYLISALLGIKHNNKNIKIITHAHATKFSDHKFRNIRNRIFSIPNKFIPDIYLACSEVAGRSIFGNKFIKKGQVLNNAIDISKFCPDIESRKNIRHELDLDNKYVIGHVGNFNTQKNHLFLIEKFYELKKEKDNVVLVLVGDGERKEQILNKCKELHIIDKVIFLGVRKDVNKIMNAFDCFVLPSIYEGLGIVLIEAQATGVPCVFSDVVPKEANIIKENNSVLPLNGNTNIWIESILNSENKREKNPKKKIQDAGFDINIETRKLEKIYRQEKN